MFRALVVFLLFTSIGFAQRDTFDSGGPLSPEQAAYDVFFYDLSLTIDPPSKSIRGSNTIHASANRSMTELLLDFDARFSIDSILTLTKFNGWKTTTFERNDSQILIDLQDKKLSGETLQTQIYYHGQPREAPNPPWSGGFSWKSAPNGEPWVSVSCQNNGADIWWPCKDHPSDEPDSMSLRFRFPDHLICISSGALQKVTDHGDGTKTFHWFVSTPINNYGVSFYIGPYQAEEIIYKSVTGETFPMALWFLDGDYQQHADLVSQIPQHVRFFEELLGPYPFRADKFATVQAPYLGMEHQSCIAYGALPGFNYGGYTEFDGLHLHELAHEWWGNMITASDWKDFWLHEGFATYMEALYAEQLNGKQSYLKVVNRFAGSTLNIMPIAPTESRSTQEIYGGDIYFKGAAVLHTLRYALGDDHFFELLERFLYPTPELKNATDGRHCRLVDTNEFIDLVNDIAGRDLSWFFDVYLRQAELPVLQVSIRDQFVDLLWKTDPLPFYLDVPIKVGNEIIIADMSSGQTSIKLEPFVPPDIDPDNWILKQMSRVSHVANEGAVEPFVLRQNYPNPFNHQTQIEFHLPYDSFVELTLHNIRGEQLNVLASRRFAAGTHSVVWNASDFPSGTYSYRLRADEFEDIKQLILIK